MQAALLPQAADVRGAAAPATFRCCSPPLAPSASRALIGCLACALLALRPVGAVDSIFEWCLAPLRLVAEMAAPVGWLGSRERAKESREVVRAWPQDVAEHRELEEAVLESALPSGQLDQRWLTAVHGEVVGRERGARDRLRVRVQDSRWLAPGQPVVHGDWYVGQVYAVPGGRHGRGLAPNEVVVELVTAAQHRICARTGGGLPEETVRMVVGGLAPYRQENWLAVHNPSRRTDPGRLAGWIEVHEPEAWSLGASLLANGFLLGDLTYEPGSEALGVRPGLDYESGLYQVLILAPTDPSQRAVEAAVEERSNILQDDAWRSARLVLRRSPSSWREGTTLAMGTLSGVRAGAALAAGARLFGRIERAGPFLSTVRTLGDPGFSVAALALVEGEFGSEPHVLGRLTSVGRDEQGRVLMRWPATVPLRASAFPSLEDDATSIPAQLWTGSGEPGIPRGLRIGAVQLPFGPGPHLLVVEQPSGTRQPARVEVRLPDHALLEGLEGGGS